MTERYDDTVRVRRGGADHAPEDATAISSRRAGQAEGDTTDQTAPDVQTEPVTETQPATETDPPPGPRRAPAEDDELDDSVDDGSTVVARRESRRRQERAEAARAAGDQGIVDEDAHTAQGTRTHPGRGLAATLAADVPAPLGRVAQAPDNAPAASPVRTAAPLIVSRTPPPAREPQETVDTESQRRAARRRSRRLAATVIALASALVLVAATALIVISVMG